MSFYEDMLKSLSEAIDMEKGNLPVTEKDNMPSSTYYVEDVQTICASINLESRVSGE